MTMTTLELLKRMRLWAEVDGRPRYDLIPDIDKAIDRETRVDEGTRMKRPNLSRR